MLVRKEVSGSDFATGTTLGILKIHPGARLGPGLYPNGDLCKTSLIRAMRGKSGRGLPQSKTLTRSRWFSNLAKRLGVRQFSGAFSSETQWSCPGNALQLLQKFPKAVERS
jgi:hypothetical protein